MYRGHTKTFTVQYNQDQELHYILSKENDTLE